MILWAKIKVWRQHNILLPPCDENRKLSDDAGRVVVKFTTIFRLKCKCAICQRTNWVHRPRLKANKTHTKSSQDQHVEENIFNMLKFNQGDIVNEWYCSPYNCCFYLFFYELLCACVCVSICICICIRICKRESACLVLWSISLPWASEHLWDTGRLPGSWSQR